MLLKTKNIPNPCSFIPLFFICIDRMLCQVFPIILTCSDWCLVAGRTGIAVGSAGGAGASLPGPSLLLENPDNNK